MRLVGSESPPYEKRPVACVPWAQRVHGAGSRFRGDDGCSARIRV